MDKENPPSASTFNIGSDPLIRAVNKETQNIRYTLSQGRKLPMITFADDHLKGLTITDPGQIDRILDIYKKYQEVSGLKVSVEKTVILGINTEPELLQEIAARTGIKIVTEFKHLGLQIRPTYMEMLGASYAGVEEGIATKCNRINSSHVDLFHRRQLIKTVVMPSFNHVYMTFEYNAEYGQRIDNQILRLLWTKKANGVIRQGRRLVAKKRINVRWGDYKWILQGTQQWGS
jgi:hypothetical protein